MLWYEVLILILGIMGSVFGILGISAYINERMKYRASKRNKQDDKRELEKEEEKQKLRNLEHEQYKKELSEIINSAITPLAKDIEQIKNDLAKNTEGTVTLLRTDMKNSADKYKDRGYASAGDRANWNELYSTYDRLGGNHFREYVDGWKEEILNLPFKKESTKKGSAKKAANKKQILTESK